MSSWTFFSRVRVAVLLSVVMAASVAIWPASASSSAPTIAERIASSPIPIDPAPARTDADAAGALRHALGLDTGQVQTLLGDDAARARGARLGIPLTAAEKAVVDRNLAVIESSRRVLRRVAKVSSATFAGRWYDLANGRLVVAYTDIDPGRTDALRALSPRPASVEVVRMPYSVRELGAASNRILAAKGAAHAKGIDIEATSAREDISGVVVYVARPAATSATEVARLAGVPADIVTLAQAHELRNDSSKGGEFLTYNNPCSVAGWARSWAGNDVLVTAGHCEDYMWSSTNGENTGSAANFYSTQQESQSAGADAQAMAPQYGESPNNIARRWTAGDVTVSGVDYLGGPYSVNGAIVCNSGWATHGVSNCGAITDTDFSKAEYYGLYRAQTRPTGGDSGATIYGYSNNSSVVPRVGVLKGEWCNPTCGSPTSLTVFSHQQRVANLIGLQYWY